MAGCVRQAPEDRRERTASLLTAYLAALRRGSVSEVECSDDDAREQLGLLQLVLYFVSFVVAKHQLWSGQGNTVRDGSAWSHRVTGKLTPVGHCEDGPTTFQRHTTLRREANFIRSESAFLTGGCRCGRRLGRQPSEAWQNFSGARGACRPRDAVAQSC